MQTPTRASREQTECSGGNVLYGRFWTDEKLISSSALKVDLISWVIFCKHSGFLRSKYISPDNRVADVSEPATISTMALIISVFIGIS